nr:pyridoxal phosphate-dependent aminotransferase [Granulosicoccus sp.]
MKTANSVANEIPCTAKSIDRFVKSEMLSLTNETVRYDLAESVCSDLTLSDVLGEADYKNLAATPLGYSSAAGNSQLRELIAQRHNDVSADDVVITVGGMHALFLLGQILCVDDKEILIHQPSFPLTVLATQTTNMSVRTFRSDFQHRYRIRPDAVEQQLSPSTGLLFLENPRNPSGVCTDASTVSALLHSMKRVCPDAYLVIDETYREASYANSGSIASMMDKDLGIRYPRLVVTGSLSKSHGAP